MRSLKTFMKAKKPMWRCGECKCVTLQCRRENDEFCNCGEQMTFMTYEELVALGSVDAIVNELNKNPRGYLNSLTEEWHTQQSPEPGIELNVIVSHPDTPLIIDNRGFAIITHSDDPDLPTPLNTWVAIPYGPTNITITFAINPQWVGRVVESDWETEVTSIAMPTGTTVRVERGQDTFISFDTPDGNHTEYFPDPILAGSSFDWVFIGETEVTGTPVALTENTTLTVEFLPPEYNVGFYYNESAGELVDQNGDTVRDGDELAFVHWTTIVVDNNNVLTLWTGDDAIILTPTPEEGFEFLWWYYWQDGIEEEELPLTSLTLTDNIEVLPRMVPTTSYTYTIDIDPDGYWEVTDLDGNTITSIVAYDGDTIFVNDNDPSELIIESEFATVQNFLMTPTGSNMLIWAFFGQDQITSQPTILDAAGTITVKFEENSR